MDPKPNSLAQVPSPGIILRRRRIQILLSRWCSLADPGMPRKILFLVNTLGFGGTERNVALLAERMDRSRYLPEVWTLLGGGVREERLRRAGVVLRSLNRPSVFNVPFALRAAREIAASDADLIQVFLPTFGFYMGLSHLVARSKKPWLMYEGTTHYPVAWKQWLQSAVLRLGCRGGIANSEPVRDFLASLGLPKHSIEVIPNGHELEPFRAPVDREEVRAELRVPTNGRLILFVGRLIETKRVVDLLEATARLDRASGGHVRIVGDGPELKRLERRSAELGLDERVHFLGARPDVPRLLRAADLFVYPSELEGLSNAVIEAALSRLPIVACDVPGVRDVVRGDSEAILVRPRDPRALSEAIARLLADREEAERLGQAAGTRAEAEYRIENTLERLYVFYDRILKKDADGLK